MTLVIDRATATAALDPRGVVDAVAATLAVGGGTWVRHVDVDDTGHTHVVVGRGDGRLVVKANVYRDGAVAGAVLVIDEAGALVAALDSGVLTAARTAAVTVHAVERLRPGSRPVVAVLGAGRQGRAQCRYVRTLVDVAELRVWSRTGTAVEEADVVAPTVGGAVAGADLVVTVTPATEPLLPLAALAPTALVVALGADMVGKAELGQDVLDTATLVGVDLPVVRRHGELRRVPDRPAAELAAAEPSPGLTVVACAGSALLDLAAAELILATVDPMATPSFALS